MKTIVVRYFATLREQAGTAQETVTVDSLTPEALYTDLAQRHCFTLPSSSVRVAFGDEFGAMQDPLMDGSEVTFIPPVAGG